MQVMGKSLRRRKEPGERFAVGGMGGGIQDRVHVSLPARYLLQVPEFTVKYCLEEAMAVGILVITHTWVHHRWSPVDGR